MFVPGPGKQRLFGWGRQVGQDEDHQSIIVGLGLDD